MDIILGQAECHHPHIEQGPLLEHMEVILLGRWIILPARPHTVKCLQEETTLFEDAQITHSVQDHLVATVAMEEIQEDGDRSNNGSFCCSQILYSIS